MKKKEKKALPPVSLEYYRQHVFECAASLMGENYDKEEIMAKLLNLADRPILNTKVKVVFEGGVVTEVLADNPVDVEVVSIDKDYGDYEQLQDYVTELHKDGRLSQIAFTSANFEGE